MRTAEQLASSLIFGEKDYLPSSRDEMLTVKTTFRQLHDFLEEVQNDARGVFEEPRYQNPQVHNGKALQAKFQAWHYPYADQP